MMINLLRVSVLFLILLALNACSGSADGVMGAEQLSASPNGNASSSGSGSQVPVQSDPSLPPGKGCSNGGTKYKNAKNPIFSLEAYCSASPPSASNDDILLSIELNKDMNGSYPVKFSLSSVENSLSCSDILVSLALCDDPNNTGSCVQQPASSLFFQILVDGEKLSETLQKQSSVFFRIPGMFNFVVTD